MGQRNWFSGYTLGEPLSWLVRQRKGFSEYTLFGGAPDRLVGQRKGFSSSENLAQAEDKEQTRARCRSTWSEETHSGAASNS